MSIKNRAKKAVPTNAGWGRYLDNGTLLGDGLDIAASFGKYISAAFGRRKDKVQDDIYTTPPIDVLEQDLILNVTTRSSARRAAKLMLARLSPLPETQIEWDIVGPHSTEDIELDDKADGNQFKNIQSKFTLGIVRKIDLEHWDSQQVGHHSLKTIGRSGDVYGFTSTLSSLTGRKQTLALVLIFAGCYLGLLWGAAQWANRPSMIAGTWQNQARITRLSNQTVRSELDHIQTSIALSEQYKENTRGVDILDMLADMTKSLAANGWIREMNLSGNQIRLSGTTDNPAKLAAQMEAKPYIKQVQLGAVSADRSSGLQRFTLTIFLVEQTP
jgi:Fimbrial assembly protein (PilN)